MIELSLEGQVALITGGSKGIGAAIARTFAEAGASVAISARNQDQLEVTAKEIEAAGGRALPIQADATQRDEVRAMVKQTVGELGTIDILVNNVGGAPFLSTLDRVMLAGFEKYVGVNLMSAVYCSRAVAPILMKQGSGVVLNVASVSGLIASPGLSYYAAAKAGLISLTRTTAKEWAAYGIRANALAPGWIDTDMNQPMRDNPELLRATVATIPLGRLGTPEEVAGAALFLCSPAASWITGTVLLMDGGQLLGTGVSL